MKTHFINLILISTIESNRYTGDSKKIGYKSLIDSIFKFTTQ